MPRILCLWFPADPPGDRRELPRLAEFAESFLPLVGWQALSASIPGIESWFAPGDCLFGEVSGVREFWGGEEQLLVRVEEGFRERGHCPRLAIADTVGAAWGAARFATRLADVSRPTPQGRIVPAGKSARALRRLPLEALRLSPFVRERLRQLGIEDLEQFAKIPRAELRCRLGREPIERWDQLVGTAWERIVAHRAALEFAAQASLEPPVTSRDHLEPTLARLARALVRQLEPHRRGASRLECRLESVHGVPLRLTIDLFRPTARAEQWLELLRLRLEQAQLPGPIQHVWLEIRQTALLVLEQRSLFAEFSGEGPSPATRRGLAHLLERLGNRLGASAVVHARLERDPCPELAYSEHSWLEFGGGGNRSVRGGSATPPGPFHRPLGLYRSPRPIRVPATDPAGAPLRMAGPEGESPIVACGGPERIEVGWWRGPRSRRDYFRVETEDGRRFWLFRDLDKERWFLHGEF